MIETREEYERAKYVARSQSGRTLGQAMETIEALREVARAAENALNYDSARGIWTLSDEEARDMQEAYARIPDWVTEEA